MTRIKNEFKTPKIKRDWQTDYRTRMSQDPEWVERYKAYQESYRKANAGNIRTSQSEYAKRYHREIAVGRHGLTMVDYVAMLDAQDGQCAICGTNDPGGRWNTMCVDHDKITGQVRGLLCDKCNRGIGFLNHSLYNLEMAKSYLQKYIDPNEVREFSIEDAKRVLGK